MRTTGAFVCGTVFVTGTTGSDVIYALHVIFDLQELISSIATAPYTPQLTMSIRSTNFWFSTTSR